MEIRINKPRDIQSSKSAPLPEQARRTRKKTVQKIGKGTIVGRRLALVFKIMAKAAVALLIVLFLLSIFVYAFTSDKFNLHTIAFHGCKKTNSKQLEEMIRRDFSGNVLRIDLHRLKTRLEKETWIKKVEIQRVLPSDLVISIQERSPSAILEISGELMLADSDGTLLDAYDPAYGKLNSPVIKGFLGKDADGFRHNCEENAARIQQALDMLAEIESGSPSYAHRISEIDVSDRANLKILLVDDSAEIHLGEKDYLKRFRKLIDHWGDYEGVKNQYNDDIVYVDLSLPGKILYHYRDKDK
jgi:cell division septal protein FtsQ